MGAGTVTMPLRPDILPGQVFGFALYKGPRTWDFYIDSVAHKFVWGRFTGTTLGLSRGLPSDVYAQSAADGLLQAIHTGKAMRQDGDYAIGMPAVAGKSSGLVAFGSPDAVQSLFGQIWQTYQTPQQK
jgi:hypothetical protein